MSMCFVRIARRLVMAAAALVWGVGQAQALSWSWSNPQPHGNDVVGMAWNGTVGVQVADCGQVYTSPDLINWTPHNSHLTNDLQAVTFFGKRVVITGAYGAVAYSDDGTNFTAGSLSTSNWIVSVAASPKLVVAVGDNGVIYTSTDGANWSSPSYPPDLNGDWLLSVAYGNGEFVATGEEGYIANSSNGTNWSATPSLNMTKYYDVDVENVTWLNGSGSATTFPYQGFWIVTDNNESVDSYALYSTDNGSSWTQVTFGTPPTNVLYNVIGDANTTLLVGDDTVRLGATNGTGKAVAWPEQISAAATATNSVPPWTYFTSVLQSNGVYELAGYDGMLVESYVTNGAYAWNTPYTSAHDWLWQVTVENGLYVAVGDNVRVMTSPDGADWSIEEVPEEYSISNATTVFLCVGGTTNLLLAAGTSGSLATSPYTLVPVLSTNLDGSVSTNYASSLGLAWYPQPAPTGTTNDLDGMGMFKSKFFLVGGNGTLLVSPNGTNDWARLASSTSNYLSGITGFTNSVFTNGLFVLSGNEGTLLTSTNGTNWVTVLAGGTNWLTHTPGLTTNWLYRTHEFNHRLLSVGENGVLLTSTNGTNWIALNSGVTNWLNDAIAISNTCYVIGNQGVVLASTNFLTWTNPANITWTGAGCITTKALESAATQNGQLLVVGFEGSILRSQIVSQPVNFLQYAQMDGYNVWSVAGTVGQTFTLDTSTNLLNWITGPALDLIYADGTLIFYEPVTANPAPSPEFYRCTLVP